MTKSEQNIAIAKILGFKIYDPGNGYLKQWEYPEKYKHIRYESPLCLSDRYDD